MILQVFMNIQVQTTILPPIINQILTTTQVRDHPTCNRIVMMITNSSNSIPTHQSQIIITTIIIIHNCKKMTHPLQHPWCLCFMQISTQARVLWRELQSSQGTHQHNLPGNLQRGMDWKKTLCINLKIYWMNKCKMFSICNKTKINEKKCVY